MNIVHITSVHPYDDIRILHKQAASQAKMGWKVSVVALNRTCNETRHSNINGVDVWHLGAGDIQSRAKRSTVGAWRVTKKAIGLKPDIVTAHDPELIPYLVYLRARGVKTIFDAHEDFVQQNKSKDWTGGAKRNLLVAYSRFLRMMASTTCWKILAATEGVAEPYPTKKTLVIKNYPIAGELGEINPEDVATLPKRLVYIGGLSPVRGIREIIKAAELCQELEGLDLAGPFETPEFEAEMRALTGWSKVKYHGMQDREGVSKLLTNSRGGLVTLHPTPNHLHSIPIKMMEYFSVGLPVIASNFPYWAELVEQKKTGFQVNPLDFEAISVCMKELVNCATCQSMVSNVISGPKLNYDWQTQSDILNTTISTVDQTH